MDNGGITNSNVANSLGPLLQNVPTAEVFMTIGNSIVANSLGQLLQNVTTAEVFMTILLTQIVILGLILLIGEFLGDPIIFK